MTTLGPFSTEPPAYSAGTEGGLPVFIDPLVTVLSQYANSPILMSLIGSFSQALDRQKDFDAFFDAIWKIESANSQGLDIWGRIVGVSRALFIADDHYLGFSESDGVEDFGSGIFFGAGSLTPNYRLTDFTYRRLILAKAALNITNGSIPAINAILLTIFPDYGNTCVRDNLNMTMTFVFGAVPTKVDYAIVTQSGVLPKPVGVSFTVEHP